MGSSATFGCDVSTRGRLRLTGEDRARFLNGQVTNDVKNLAPGTGCYAAFANGKGKMRADAVILNHDDSLLLDLEAGYDASIAVELDKFIIADDVLVEGLTEVWRAFAIVGARAGDVLRDMNLCDAPPARLFDIASNGAGSSFVFRSRRSITDSFDVWVQLADHEALSKRLRSALEKAGGGISDISELEISRIEAGIPRFGVEMDEGTLPPEAGIESVAISYTKGCYLGQEVIARIKSVGHVNRTLARLQLPDAAQRKEPLLSNGKEVGRLGSAVTSPRFGRIGLAIIRREAASPGTRLALPQGEAVVVADFTSPR